MGNIIGITQKELKQLQDNVDAQMDYLINVRGLSTINTDEDMWDIISDSMRHTFASNDDLVDDAIVYLANRYPGINFIDNGQ